MLCINIMVSIFLGFNVRILVGRQYWNSTVVIGFFCLLVLDIVPIRVVTVMTNTKTVCVLLAFLVPMLVLVMRLLRIKLLMTR